MLGLSASHRYTLAHYAAGLHKSDQQYIKSAKAKARKPEDEFLYATTASKRAERQRLVRFIRCVHIAVCHTFWQQHANQCLQLTQVPVQMPWHHLLDV